MEFIIYLSYTFCVAVLLLMLVCAILMLVSLVRDWLNSRK